MKTNYRKVDPNEKLPPKNTNGRPSDDWWSDSYFVMTDNGKTIAYYNFKEEEWMFTYNDHSTKVLYWLEEYQYYFLILQDMWNIITTFVF